MRRPDNLATFMCQLSESTGSLKLLEPSLGLFSDTFTSTKKRISRHICLVHAINASPSAFLFTVTVLSSMVFDSAYSITGSVHLAEHKANRPTNPLDLCLLR